MVHWTPTLSSMLIQLVCILSLGLAKLPVLEDLNIWEGVADYPEKDIFQVWDAFETPIPTSVGNGSGDSTTRTSVGGELSSTRTNNSGGNGNGNTSTSRTNNSGGNGNGNGGAPSRTDPVTSVIVGTTRISGMFYETVDVGVVYEVTETAPTYTEVVETVVIKTETVASDHIRLVRQTYRHYPSGYHQPTTSTAMTTTSTTTTTEPSPSYPVILPSPLHHIPRRLCRRFPLLCANAGIPHRHQDNDEF